MLYALVIGAGIHGLTFAIELAKRGVKVTILEKQTNFLLGASSGTHNRAHLGYHYPRSLVTAKECLDGYRYFIENYPQALYCPEKSYYLVENSSLVNTHEYKEFCLQANLDFQMEWPDESFVIKDSLQSSFMVKEPCFNLGILKDYFANEIIRLGISINFGFMLKNVKIMSPRELEITNQRGERMSFKSDIVINATYTATNNIQKVFGCSEKLTKYHYHLTEVVVAESDMNIPALTVMDGPFVTILPYARNDILPYARNDSTTRKYLIYDVKNSVVNKKTGLIYEGFEMKDSNWSKMLEHGAKYFPFIKSMKYCNSLWANRPVPADITDDSRNTRTIKHDCMEAFYSILEGKFISAPLIAVQLVDQIVKDLE